LAARRPRGRSRRARTERDIDTTFDKLAQLRPSGLVIGNDPFFNSWSERFASNNDVAAALDQSP
jgi:hypothetical protein